MTTDSRPPYRAIIEDGIPEEDQGAAFLNVNRCVNMTGERASDAARAEVAAYRRMGAEAWRAEFVAARASERLRSR